MATGDACGELVYLCPSAIAMSVAPSQISPFHPTGGLTTNHQPPHGGPELLLLLQWLLRIGKLRGTSSGFDGVIYKRVLLYVL